MLTEILKTARGEIGYREGADNNNKYGAEYGLNGQPWCVIFLWWCFKHSGCAELFPVTAHCDGVRDYAVKNGRWLNAPCTLQPGDIVIWDCNSDGSGDHAGIAETVEGGTFTSIEGNCADSVCRVRRSFEGISGIYRPDYGTAEGGKNANAYPAFGSSGYRVRVIQAVLMLCGYNLGPCGIDGEFGGMTEAALKAFQKKNGIDCDGIAGPETLKAMWKGEK